MLVTYADELSEFVFNLGAPGEAQQPVRSANSRPVAENPSWRVLRGLLSRSRGRAARAPPYRPINSPRERLDPRVAAAVDLGSQQRDRALVVADHRRQERGRQGRTPSSEAGVTSSAACVCGHAEIGQRLG